MWNKAVLVSCALLMAAGIQAQEAVDASDPTKIYSYLGPGYKYTNFTNDDELHELRLIGNLGIGSSDMVMFELGYGKYFVGDDSSAKDDTGITNGRARYFHLFTMDYSVLTGYRGWATQIDMQFEGGVEGTKGSNTLAIGALPAFGINSSWSFYLPLNYVSTWGEDFDQHNGHGVSIAPMVAYAPEKGLWPGFFLQIWPSWTRYLSGDLDGEGGANIDLTVGGSITERLVMTGVFQHNFDKNFNYHPRAGSGNNTSGTNDWNIFINLNWYFF